MQPLTFDMTAFEVVPTKRKADPEFEMKKLLIPEFLSFVPINEMQLKIRMWDGGYRTAQSWMELLSECKQAKNPAACFGAKTKLR